MNLAEEQKLVEKAKSDSSAFALLYDEYFSRIFKFVSRRVFDENLVEDLVSQTFLDALSNIKKYEDRGIGFLPWLYKIAYNNVLKSIKKEGPRKVDIEEAYSVSSSENVEKEVKDGELKEHVKLALKKMDYDEAELLRLKYFEGCKNNEIAKIVGISANNVGVKMYRALKKFKEIVGSDKKFD